jgi:regulator of protease activity HflC (stomatin/prohibitin superfamily)
MIELLLIGAGTVVGLVALTGVRVLQQYERAVVFRLGHARKA